MALAVLQCSADITYRAIKALEEASTRGRALSNHTVLLILVLSNGEELARLATELARHDRLYFELAAPAISDEQYDALAARNAAMEAEFPSLIRSDSRSHRLVAHGW